ncbi:MAG: PfkB family carbohydrate kinase [Pseudomonadota bacterium]
MSPPLVLILSSHVAASPVGGSAQAAALAGVGVETMLVPTVLFGRHPGLGAPGGGPVGIEIFEGMLAGVEAAGVFGRLDAAVTGYFAQPAQVAAAARALDAIRAVNREAWVIVDPIMGDRGVGLYIDEAVARAVAGDLVSRADLIAPNAWELERLTGRGAADPASALAAARSLDRPVLVSSVEIGADIGVIYADAGQAWLASHPRQADAPRGSGDRLTALFAGAVLGGASPREALERSVRAVAGLATGAPVDVRLEALG